MESVGGDTMYFVFCMMKAPTRRRTVMTATTMGNIPAGWSGGSSPAVINHTHTDGEVGSGRRQIHSFLFWLVIGAAAD